MGYMKMLVLTMKNNGANLALLLYITVVLTQRLQLPIEIGNKEHQLCPQ